MIKLDFEPPKKKTLDYQNPKASTPLRFTSPAIYHLIGRILTISGGIAFVAGIVLGFWHSSNGYLLSFVLESVGVITFLIGLLCLKVPEY